MGRTDDGELLTPHQVAKRCKVSRRTVYGWIARGQGDLSAVNMGAGPKGEPRWKVSERALVEFLERRGNKSVQNVSDRC